MDEKRWNMVGEDGVGERAREAQPHSLLPRARRRYLRLCLGFAENKVLFHVSLADRGVDRDASRDRRHGGTCEVDRSTRLEKIPQPAASTTTVPSFTLLFSFSPHHVAKCLRHL